MNPSSPVSSRLLPDPLAALPAAINHLLAREAWAREVLIPHAGKILAVTASPFEVRLAVTAAGLVERASRASASSARVEVPLALLPQLAVGGPMAVQARIKLDGDAAFAQAVSEVVRRLRWDAEEDLSRVIGDIGARRVTRAANSLWTAARTSQRRLAENFAEFWLEEKPELVRPRHLEEHSARLRAVRDDLARLEKRIERLETRSKTD